MRTFREYALDQDFDAIKRMVFNVLDPQQNTIDPESKSVLTRPLSEFKGRDKLLTSPGLADIINRSKNREAIVTAIQNQTTTIGNLLSLLSQTPEQEPKYLG